MERPEDLDEAAAMSDATELSEFHRCLAEKIAVNGPFPILELLEKHSRYAKELEKRIEKAVSKLQTMYAVNDPKLVSYGTSKVARILRGEETK